MKYKLTIPTSLKEIKLKQYQLFLKVASENDNENFLQQKAIQIFCGVPLMYVNEMKQKDVNDIANKIIALFSNKPKLINRFKIGDLEFGFIPNLDEMTSGEYIDLDSYFTDWQQMHKAMAVLYRPITEKQKDKYLIEPYVSSINYAEVMEQMPLEVALSATVFFLDFRNRLIEKYEELFRKGQSGNEYSETAQFGQKWGWYSSVYGLAQGDIRRFDEVTKLNIHQCLTFLMFESEKQNIEAKLITRK